MFDISKCVDAVNAMNVKDAGALKARHALFAMWREAGVVPAYFKATTEADRAKPSGNEHVATRRALLVVAVQTITVGGRHMPTAGVKDFEAYLDGDKSKADLVFNGLPVAGKNNGKPTWNANVNGCVSTWKAAFEAFCKPLEAAALEAELARVIETEGEGSEAAKALAAKIKPTPTGKANDADYILDRLSQIRNRFVLKLAKPENLDGSMSRETVAAFLTDMDALAGKYLAKPKAVATTPKAAK